MSVRCDASGDFLGRTTNLPSNLRGVTMCCYAKIVVDRNDWSCPISLSNGTTYYAYIETNTDGVTYELWNVSGGTAMFTASVGAWYFLAQTTSATGTHKAYWAAVGDATLSTVTHTGGVSDSTPTIMKFGESCFAGEFLNGNISNPKVWTAELTQAELELEMRSIRPHRFTNLWGWFPTFTGSGVRGKDFSGNGYDLTENGTLADEDNPAVSWGVRSIHVPIVSAGTPTFIQEGYRWRNDNEDEDHATWAYDQDVEGSQLMNNNIRLRVLVDTTNDTAATQYRLEYRKHDSSDAWQTVTT